MSASILTCVVSALSIFGHVSSAPYHLEADDFAANLMVSEGRVMPRSSAMNDKNLWMKKGETLKMMFCLDLDAVVSVRNVCWANDGWMDRVVVKINDQLIGNFTTKAQSNWGHLWNVLYSSGPIGDEMALTSGEHELSLEIPDADIYGVEIDKVILEVDGEIRQGDLACIKEDEVDETADSELESVQNTRGDEAPDRAQTGGPSRGDQSLHTGSTDADGDNGVFGNVQTGDSILEDNSTVEEMSITSQRDPDADDGQFGYL